MTIRGFAPSPEAFHGVIALKNALANYTGVTGIEVRSHTPDCTDILLRITLPNGKAFHHHSHVPLYALDEGSMGVERCAKAVYEQAVKAAEAALGNG